MSQVRKEGEICFPKGYLRNIRRNLNMVQKKFWAKIGVNQHTGSRYERGMPLPRPVFLLFDLVYLKEVALEEATRENIRILELFRQDHPRQYLLAKRRVRIKGRVQCQSSEVAPKWHEWVGNTLFQKRTARRSTRLRISEVAALWAG